MVGAVGALPRKTCLTWIASPNPATRRDGTPAPAPSVATVATVSIARVKSRYPPLVVILTFPPALTESDVRLPPIRKPLIGARCGSAQELQSSWENGAGREEAQMSGEPDEALEVLRGIWSAQGQTSADLEDIGTGKSCKRMADVGFGEVDGAEDDLRAAWRDRLEREGKLSQGGTVADLVLGPAKQG